MLSMDKTWLRALTEHTKGTAVPLGNAIMTILGLGPIVGFLATLFWCASKGKEIHLWMPAVLLASLVWYVYLCVRAYRTVSIERDRANAIATKGFDPAIEPWGIQFVRPSGSWEDILVLDRETNDVELRVRLKSQEQAELGRMRLHLSDMPKKQFRTRHEIMASGTDLLRHFGRWRNVVNLELWPVYLRWLRYTVKQEGSASMTVKLNPKQPTANRLDPVGQNEWVLVFSPPWHMKANENPRTLYLVVEAIGEWQGRLDFQRHDLQGEPIIDTRSTSRIVKARVSGVKSNDL
jgi:hypothetical protein